VTFIYSSLKTATRPFSKQDEDDRINSRAIGGSMGKLVEESGQHLQPIAVDASRAVDDSSFLKNLHEDGIAA
jgi:hypothetical protein